jgi:hypothetical protein
MKSLIELDLVNAIQRDRNRKAQRAAALAIGDDVVIRRAKRADAGRLQRLAQLDSGRAPAGPALVAELDGVLVAAVPLHDGRPLADPFVPSAAVVKLLELRRAQLRAVL